jgi:regulator of PEP synthase PpsR (kinase-PPPase family)
VKSAKTFFHLHLVSDSTGETLTTVARAAAAQYDRVQAIEHLYPLVRTDAQLETALSKLEEQPGIVLYTLVNDQLAERLENICQGLGIPCVSVLQPVLGVFKSYLNAEVTHRVGGQHALDADYFRRIDALNFTMIHDDGQLPENVDDADIIVVGISRTSKTPTCIYLANRGYKAANVPIVKEIEIPANLFAATRPLIVGLVASPERILQVRQNRLLSLNAAGANQQYVNRHAIADEVAYTRRLCAARNWPIIDVTRRSIEETAVEILAHHRDHLAARELDSPPAD